MTPWFGLFPGPAPEPTIAFMRLTQDVGQQIRDDWANRTSGVLALQLEVSWTPTVSAPEPATLLLVGTALAAAVRRRRTRW